MSKNCTIENITNIFEKFVFLKFINLKKSLFETNIIYEFSSILKQTRFEKSEIYAIVNVTNIFDKFVVLKSIDWFAFTNLQKSSFKKNNIDEFSSVLNQILCDLFEIIECNYCKYQWY